MKNNQLSLRDLQKRVQSLCKKKGWDKLSDEKTFILLVEEVGELAKAIRKENNFLGEKTSVSRANLEEELADVLSYLADIANRFNIDLEKAYLDKENKLISK